MTGTAPSEPPSLDADLDVIAEYEWRAFNGLDSMTNHWDRPGWHDGRSSFHWMLYFADEPRLLSKVLKDQQLVPGIGFDLVPPESVHLTLGRIGFTDEISWSTARSVADHAVESLESLAAFTIRVGSLTGSRGAIRYSVAPWRPVVELQRALTAATRKELGDEGTTINTATFKPHIGIAYSNRTQAIDEVSRRLAQTRPAQPTEVRVTSVSLVRMQRSSASYLISPELTLRLLDR